MSNRTIQIEQPSTDELNGVPNLNSQNGEMVNSVNASTSEYKGTQYNHETKSKYDSNSSSGDKLAPKVTGNAVRRETAQVVKQETSQVTTHKQSEDGSLSQLILPTIILACIFTVFIKFTNKVGNALSAEHGSHGKHRHH